MNNDYNSDLKPKIPIEKITLFVGIPLVAIIVVALIIFNFVHVYREYDIVPGCATSGGHYRECKICGEVEQVTSLEPHGHKPAAKVVKEPTAATYGEKEMRCTVCQQLINLEKTPPKISPIPSFRLIGRGAGMTATNSISATFSYTDGAESEEIKAAMTGGDVKVRLMNSGERVDAKHSYVLTDFHVTEGDKLLFGDFGDSEQIDLYANNDDPTFARRIITYRQWKHLVSELYPEYSKYIAVSEDTEYAGYNMLLYIKSTKPDYSFAGIYTLSIPYSILARKNTSADIMYVVRQKVFENAQTSEKTTEYEFVFGAQEEIENAVNNLKSFLDISKVDEKTYDNIDVLTDYFTFSLITGNIDAFNDIYWVTSDGSIWYPVPANTEHSYGSGWFTTELVAIDSCTSDFGEFWNKLFENNFDEIKSRYRELKDTRLSLTNIKTEFNRAITKLDLDVYEEDSKTYDSEYKNPLIEAEKLYGWYEERIAYLDEFFANKL